MRVPLAAAAVAAVLLFQGDAQADSSLAQQFAHANSVVLVRVTASTYPSGANSLDYYQRSLDSTASLLVITSWKGPFPAGASIRAATQQVCGGLCAPYPFRVGKVVVVFTGDVTDPIHPFLGSVIEGASVKEAILQLDALAANSGT
jgi:hypothetical protein